MRTLLGVSSSDDMSSLFHLWLYEEGFYASCMIFSEDMWVIDSILQRISTDQTNTILMKIIKPVILWICGSWLWSIQKNNGCDGFVKGNLCLKIKTPLLLRPWLNIQQELVALITWLLILSSTASPVFILPPKWVRIHIFKIFPSIELGVFWNWKNKPILHFLLARKKVSVNEWL